jgi:hypothetical protein
MPRGDPTAAALELWSAAHGVAALLIAKPYLPWGDIDVFADRVLQRRCAAGRMAAGYIGADVAAGEAGAETVKELKA